ncbi:MAG TPA: NHL repeat-containing protein, partial [Chitinophagales bacterium]|nr:NHL repeat-containing protein [Chitinophagales bacterium]
MKKNYTSYFGAPNPSNAFNPAPMKKVLYTLTAFLAALLLFTQASTAQCTPQGDPNNFGDHVWNVYAWNSGEAADIGTSWNTNYSGYYVDTNYNFNSLNRWGNEGSPSDATGYLGCTVATEHHSFSAKKQGFTCGYYTIAITNHDDEAELWVNGVMVWEHVACCDAHSNAWTGWLTESATVEFRVTEGGGGSNGGLEIKPANILNTSSYVFNCKVSSIILSTSVPNPVWSTGATSSSITVTTPGNYSVTYDGGLGCPVSSSASITNAPDVSASLSGPACHGAQAKLTASVTGTMASIKWKKNGTTIANSAPSWGNRTVVAGNNGAGSGLNQFNSPFAVAVDGGVNMYIADNANGRIMKWAPGASSGTVVANGVGFPQRLFLDKNNNLYVSDYGSSVVYKFVPGSGTGVVVAGGNGFGSAANQLAQATGIYVDDAGNVYVNDGSNARIQKWAPGATSGMTVAGGNGQGNGSNQWQQGNGLWLDAAGN